MTDAEDKQIVNGWQFPAEVDVPAPGDDSGFWDRVSHNNETYWVLKVDGAVDVARQMGVTNIQSEIVAHSRETIEKTNRRQSLEEDSNGNAHVVQNRDSSSVEEVPYCAVRSTVEYDGETFARIGSTDATTNDLEDMFSTAESRSVKRAIKAALNVRRVGPGEQEVGGSRGGNDNGW